MSEQDKEFDVEGHRVGLAEGVEEDTEGHRVRHSVGEGLDEDTEAHQFRHESIEADEDDVEGHVQPPRDTDLGNSPR